MNSLIILITKISQKILKLLGRGSAFPGSIALKLNKNILNALEIPKTTIFVTGTTGKTSVATTMYEIYKNANYKVVSNIKGSNLLPGVTTAIIESVKLSGKSKVDALVIEVDERYVKEVFKYITPNYFIINNLSRDQLARNGHYELVFDEINNSIKPKTHLILNADDPLVTKFSLNKKNKVTFYSLNENKYSTKTNKIDTLDLSYCPICHKKLNFKYFNYGNLGYYECINNDFNHPKCDYIGTLNKNILTINEEKITLKDNALYNVYNILTCYTAASITGVKKEDIIKTLNNLKVKRLTEFKINKVEGTILLSKNETPLSYNQSLEYIKSKKEDKTVAIGFTRISGRYDLRDLSWIYDINFELLNDKSIKRIILIGPFAYDLAVRLKQAGIDSKKFKYCLDYKNSFEYLLDNTKGHLYCAVYFDLDYMYIDKLKERGLL